MKSVNNFENINFPNKTHNNIFQKAQYDKTNLTFSLAFWGLVVTQRWKWISNNQLRECVECVKCVRGVENNEGRKKYANI